MSFVEVSSQLCHLSNQPWLDCYCHITLYLFFPLQFWDTRNSQPIMTINLPERCYCADVEYPMAVVGTANRHLIVYQLEGQPQEYKQIESPLKYQVNFGEMSGPYPVLLKL